MRKVWKRNIAGNLCALLFVAVIAETAAVNGQTIVKKETVDHTEYNSAADDTTMQTSAFPAGEELPQLQEGFSSILIKTLVTLIGIIVLIWVSVWAMKRFVFAPVSYTHLTLPTN